MPVCGLDGWFKAKQQLEWVMKKFSKKKLFTFFGFVAVFLSPGPITTGVGHEKKFEKKNF